MRVEGGYTWKKANRIRFRRGTFCPSAAADHRHRPQREYCLPCTIVPYFPNCKKNPPSPSHVARPAGGNLILTGGAAQPTNRNHFCVLRYISKGYYCVINGLHVPGWGTGLRMSLELSDPQGLESCQAWELNKGGKGPWWQKPFDSC